jgi:hypothetical protein
MRRSNINYTKEQQKFKVIMQEHWVSFTCRPTAIREESQDKSLAVEDFGRWDSQTPDQKVCDDGTLI